MVRRSARYQLLFILAAILFFAFIGGSLLNYTMTRAAVHSEIIKNDLPLTMDNIYSELTAEMTRPLLVSSSMAADTFLKEWSAEGELDPKRIVRYLHQIKEEYGFFTTFFVSARSKKYYRYNGIHKTISEQDLHDIWFFDFISSNQEYDFDVDTDEAANNILTIFINYRVVDKSGDLLGVVGVGLMVDKVAKSVEKYQQKYDRTVYLTDTRGVYQVHPDTTLIDKMKIADSPGLAPLVPQILQTKETLTNHEYEVDDEKILLTVRYIEPLQWFLYVEQNEAKALITARQNFIRTAVIGFFASLLIIILALLTINRYQSKIELLASSDELTGALNRRALEVEFNKNLYSYKREAKQFSLILLDLDKFKRVNDTLGHIAGDQLLVVIVEVIRKIVRPTDIFARWGGDEFVILTASNITGAEMVASRICQSLREHDFTPPETDTNDPRKQVRVSCGITQYEEGDTFDSMLLRADKAMYKCKEQGGDCIVTMSSSA